MSQNWLDELQQIFSQVFGVAEVTPSTTSDDIDAWTSLTNVQLVMTIESEFGIQFSLGEFEALENVGELSELIARKVEGKREAG